MPPALQGAEAHARGLPLLGAIQRPPWPPGLTARSLNLTKSYRKLAPRSSHRRPAVALPGAKGCDHVMAASTGPSALVTRLLRALETMEEGLAIRVIPGERSVMLLQVSKTMRTAMQRVSPPTMIKVKKGHFLT